MSLYIKVNCMALPDNRIDLSLPREILSQPECDQPARYGLSALGHLVEPKVVSVVEVHVHHGGFSHGKNSTVVVNVPGSSQVHSSRYFQRSEANSID